MRIDDGLRRLRPPAVGPFREGAFDSPVHETRTAAWLGVALGVSFIVCFLTGLFSHLIQHPPVWFANPARPVWLYRVTQGVHVATGIASIPLLLAKLWVVYPHFFTMPPMRNVAHVLERVSLLPLVGGSVFLLFSGVASISKWFPWRFSFPSAHYAAAWITIGALVVHVGAKIGATRRALTRRGREAEGAYRAADRDDGGLTRRGFLWTVAGATGVLTLTTVGQTFRPLSRLAVLAPRDPTVGPQGLPVNKTARSAGVVDAATDPGYRLSVEGRVTTPLTLSLDDLRAMPQRDAGLPIACVDGWSASASWRGVALRDLLAAAGAPAGTTVTVMSLQDQDAPYSSALVEGAQVTDPDTLLALELNRAPLDIDHGFPLRLIGPNRPGVLQTKWVQKVVVG